MVCYFKGLQAIFYIFLKCQPFLTRLLRTRTVRFGRFYRWAVGRVRNFRVGSAPLDHSAHQIVRACARVHRKTLQLKRQRPQAGAIFTQANFSRRWGAGARICQTRRPHMPRQGKIHYRIITGGYYKVSQNGAYKFSYRGAYKILCSSTRRSKWCYYN